MAPLDDYRTHKELLGRQAQAMHALVERWLAADPSLKLHSVTFRVKDEAALAEKLSRPDRTYESLWDVTDLIGLRVTTYFEDSIDAVAKVIEAHLPVDFSHSIDKRRQEDASAFGYRSLHYVCAFGDHCLPGLPGGARCEIQVRTLLQHAWAEIEHDLGYKSQHALPISLRRRFSRIASLLEIADHEFTAVRRELAEYTSRIPARLAHGDDVRIDRLSLAALIDQPLVRRVDAAIAARVSRPLDETAFFPDYLARMLVLSGVERAGEALEMLSAKEERVLALVEPYFAFAASEFKLSLQALQRGYSLFFLAHVALLQSPLLGINKADRLARFYGELDYPDDPRAAQRVAAALLAAFDR